MVVKWTFEDYWQGQTQSLTYYTSGGSQDFVVPDTTSMLQATLRGGAGGGEDIDNVESGGLLVVQFPVTPGETLKIRVAGDGLRVIPSGTTGATGGYNGGGSGGNCTAVPSHSPGYGGGGASDIRQGGDTLADRIAVAAGAGGNSGENVSYFGGPGGSTTGAAGASPAGPEPLQTPGYYGGRGGTPITGGDSGLGPDHLGTAGALGVGGNGVNSTTHNGGGGGGGGLFGGGGGAEGPGSAGGGGGGSNGVADGVTIITNGRGARAAFPDPPSVVVEFLEEADRYVFEINPDDGGSPEVTKNMAITQNVGPNRMNLVQEGQSVVPTLAFSGVILTQEHYEAMELWFDRRVLIKMVDDISRTFYGVFSKFSPKRTRRPYNPWYHTYDAEFAVTAYVNASGQRVYGRIL